MITLIYPGPTKIVDDTTHIPLIYHSYTLQHIWVIPLWVIPLIYPGYTSAIIYNLVDESTLKSTNNSRQPYLSKKLSFIGPFCKRDLQFCRSIFKHDTSWLWHTCMNEWFMSTKKKTRHEFFMVRAYQQKSCGFSAHKHEWIIYVNHTSKKHDTIRRFPVALFQNIIQMRRFSQVLRWLPEYCRCANPNDSPKRDGWYFHRVCLYV